MNIQNRLNDYHQTDEAYQPVGEDNSQQDTKQEELSYSPVIDKMTKRITFLFAAEYIADADFPNKDTLPTTKPCPFTNFGHQPLFDFELFLTIIWTTISEIKNTVKTSHQKSIKIDLAILATAAIIAIATAHQFDNYAVGIPALIIAAFIGFIIKAFCFEDCNKAVAAIRADAIDGLLYGSWHKEPNMEVKKKVLEKSKYQGDGKLSAHELPVLIIEEDNHPFPGYGRLQAEVSYACPPKEKATSQLSELDEITEKIFNTIRQSVSNMGISNISFGEILAVHGNSLSIDSPLLDKNKTPHLRLGKNDIQAILKDTDNCGSARVYKAVQVFFPDCMTLATFFVRTFMAGNVASSSVTVTTLGPPIVGTDYFKKRLLRYQYEKNEKWGNAEQEQSYDKNEDADIEGFFSLLRWVRLFSKDYDLFQKNIDAKKIRDLALKDLSDMTDTEREAYEDELNKIIKENVNWPGAYIHSQNLREDSSFTFTTDFFGRGESIATIKAIYNQISKAIIDGMDDIGFDISDYQDSEGHYTINAEKIDQLIVGEKIAVTGEKQKSSTDPDKAGE
ncbi:hypothetical protein [Thalassomonas actiniarum]|uniref:Uncharacterized protein n=1 Tax=Thalassomonas actiniarum TaxID=485447 RepID=A0AAE9YW24_9GAMM|nr:hypothetical protein [Thalassomonas actiniarum]WDE02336.1 hypothetical protein SG35_031800 [Thalassomonas actiniarum]